MIFEKSRDEVFREWVSDYSGAMYSFTMFRVSKKKDAEDIVQECFLSAFQSFEKFEGRSDPKTWLFGILKNKISDYFESKKRLFPSITEIHSVYFTENVGGWVQNQKPKDWIEEDDNHLLDNTLFLEIFNGCIEKLPVPNKEIVVLKYMRNKKSEEICQELGLSKTNYWQIIHRSKLNLRKCLEMNWFRK